MSQIAALAREASIAAVGISMVQTRRRSSGDDTLASLRRRLRRDVALVVGGAGAPSAPNRQGVTVFHDLSALDQWARSRRV